MRWAQRDLITSVKLTILKMLLSRAVDLTDNISSNNVSHVALEQRCRNLHMLGEPRETFPKRREHAVVAW